MVYSPLQKPENADAIISILSDLEGLGFLGSDSIYFGYRYQEITEEIIGRRMQYQNIRGEDPTGQQSYISMAEFMDRTWKRDNFSGSPREMAQFLIHPFPVQIEIYFRPKVWKDGSEFSGVCGLRNYRMNYTIDLNDEGIYQITRQPRVVGVYIGGEHFQTEFNDGLPIPCVNHLPYVNTCSQRFGKIKGIVEGSGLEIELKEPY